MGPQTFVAVQPDPGARQGAPRAGFVGALAAVEQILEERAQTVRAGIQGGFLAKYSCFQA
jgi:hypothetical protein